MSKVFVAPGSYLPTRDAWGSLSQLSKRVPPQTLALVDAEVARLHPEPIAELQGRCKAFLALEAGERAKSVDRLSDVIAAGLAIPRSGTLLCVGGGTLGDLATVAAHLLKRGLSLIQVPSTLLAAVDSSVGGKGALHSGGAAPVKNALGVFHYAQESWLCPELFTTLSADQIREGRIEAFKMAATLSLALWKRYVRALPSLKTLIRDARRMKSAVCKKDPYEHQGFRGVLNFGHTFGHAIETVTDFSVSHGDAVGLGILCALDVGRVLNVTSDRVAASIEDFFVGRAGSGDRKALAKALGRTRPAEVKAILAADKKSTAQGELKMVLVPGLGRAVLRKVPEETWTRLLPYWQQGERP
jgi:3-dehydroquinate synthase